MKIIEPVVLRPLCREWEEVKAKIEAEQAKAKAAEADAARTHHRNAAREFYLQFRERLGGFRVLDPACGSGNFLYLSLWHLKDFDLQVMNEAKSLAMPPDDQRVTPQTVLGIEINEYAAELARVTIWIGELQWQLRNSFGIHRSPILGALNGIECRDALLNADGSEAQWPPADAIVGNPPFLGNTFMIGDLGEDYVTRLRRCFAGRVPGAADLVTYWFEKARSELETDRTMYAGLVATNSIRGGANRKILARVRETGVVFEAWSDEPWVLEEPAVRVSLVCFTKKSRATAARLNGVIAQDIYSDLTGHIDVPSAKPSCENENVCFEGMKKYGPFDIDGHTARSWLTYPSNPNGYHNSQVLFPWINSMDIARRSSDTWVIDFSMCASERDAAFFEQPFLRAMQVVKPVRQTDRDRITREKWWLFQRTRPALRAKVASLSRSIVTPVVDKHRLFVWIRQGVLASNLLDVIARDDDTTFGILHSRFHELWALRLGTSLEDRPRYTPSTTFETLPFPEGLTPNIPAAQYADDPRAVRIADVARRLNERREAWLNPSDLVMRVPEVVPGYPDRILPVNERAAKELKKRTLTNLYNARPAWLDNIHRELDEAVAAAYGWPADLADDEVLRRLLDLNLARAAANPSPRPSPGGRGRTASTRSPRPPAGEGATPGSGPGGSG